MVSFAYFDNMFNIPKNQGEIAKYSFRNPPRVKWLRILEEKEYNNLVFTLKGMGNSPNTNTIPQIQLILFS